MASKKTLNEALRTAYMTLVSEYLRTTGEEVLITGTNEIACPCTDLEGNDEFIVITFKVPTGSRDGSIYDGYLEAEAFQQKQTEKAEKAKVAAAEKAKKIARDKAMREAKAKAKAEREAKGE